MSDYSEICLKTFLRDQEKLFDEPVAENLKKQRLSWRTAWQSLLIL